MKKLLPVIFAAAAVLLLAILIFPLQTAHTFSGDNISVAEYSFTDASHAVQRTAQIDLTYTINRFGQDMLAGDFYIRGIQGLTPDSTIEVSMEENRSVYIPYTKDASGYLSTFEVYSILHDDDFTWAILPLWSSYSAENSSMQFGDFRFLCMGDITRDEALAILKSTYLK